MQYVQNYALDEVVWEIKTLNPAFVSVAHHGHAAVAERGTYV